MPSKLVIQNEKLTRYLLMYQHKDDKSKFLADYGYTLENWEILKQDILEVVTNTEIDEVSQTAWGKRFKVKNRWTAINGRLIEVITIWQQDEESDLAKFITLYPDKS